MSHFLAKLSPRLEHDSFIPSLIHSFILWQLCQCHLTPTPLLPLSSPPRCAEWIMAQMWDAVLFPGGAVECSLPGSSVPLSLPPIYLLRRTVCTPQLAGKKQLSVYLSVASCRDNNKNPLRFRYCIKGSICTFRSHWMGNNLDAWKKITVCEVCVCK